MSDCDDYNDIDYNPDEYDEMPQNDGINLEDMYIEAENSNDIEKFRQVIELEREEGKSYTWTFKSLEKICLYNIKQKDLDAFTRNFEKLINSYTKVDDCYKAETVRNINFALHDLEDNEFSICVLRFMYQHLIDQEIDREVLNSALQLGKILFTNGKDEELGKLLDNIFSFMRRLNLNDESSNSMRLEFIIINIQYLNKVNEIDECERLYFEADVLNKEKMIKDNRINAIISEEAGKYFFRLEKYAQALENFKDAYKSYQDSGSSRTNEILRLLILCFILQRNDEVIIDTEEAKRYPDDLKLKGIVELKEAFDRLDIKKINLIIKQKLATEESDFLIKDNLNDIVRNLRINYLLKKLGLYRNIALATIEKEMDLDNNSLKCLINQLSSIGTIDVKLNLVQNCVEINRNVKDEMNLGALMGYEKWKNMLS